MIRWKHTPKWLAAAGLAGALIGGQPVWAAPAPPLAARAAILVDGNTGQVLFGRDIRGEFYPASITKIMTAYLAITHGWSKTVVVSRQAEAQIGSSAYLVAGERLPMPKVVTAMMLVSGNDAAYAVAQTVGGSVPAFVRMMNQQAKAWGAPGIHFDNPDGLPDTKHVVSALGMAIIAEHAMKNPIFAKIVDTKRSTLPPDPKPRIYYNQNQLLYDFPGAVGVKIGYTIEADETIVGAARRHGLLLIEVLLHDTPAELWPNAKSLLSWGFQNFHTVTLIRQGQHLGSVEEGGRAVPVVAAQAVHYVLPKSEKNPQITLKFRTAHPHSGRLIRRHETVGSSEVRLNGSTITTIPLESAGPIAPLPPRVGWNWWWLLLPIAVAGALMRPPRRGTVQRRQKGGSEHG